MISVPEGIEVVNPHLRRARVRAAVFDFDGTVSLIREGWSTIMADMGQDELRAQDLPMAKHEHLDNEMLRLSGKPSIFQMRRLAEIVVASGGEQPDAERLLAEFLRRLFLIADERKESIRSNKVSSTHWAVAGTHQLLEALQARDIELTLASGTDLKYVREEAELLDLTRFFGERVYAPADNTPLFSKRQVFEELVDRLRLQPSELLGFGDGYSETVELKRLGGMAVGVASQQLGLPGVHPLKRAMLIELGADVIVADYRNPDRMLAWLLNETVEDE